MLSVESQRYYYKEDKLARIECTIPGTPGPSALLVLTPCLRKEHCHGPSLADGKTEAQSKVTLYLESGGAVGHTASPTHSTGERPVSTGTTRGRLGMSGDVFVCHDWGGVEGRDAAEHPTMHRTAATAKDYQPQMSGVLRLRPAPVERRGSGAGEGAHIPASTPVPYRVWWARVRGAPGLWGVSTGPGER